MPKSKIRIATEKLFDVGDSLKEQPDKEFYTNIARYSGDSIRIYASIILVPLVCTIVVYFVQCYVLERTLPDREPFHWGYFAILYACYLWADVYPSKSFTLAKEIHFTYYTGREVNLVCLPDKSVLTVAKATMLLYKRYIAVTLAYLILGSMQEPSIPVYNVIPMLMATFICAFAWVCLEIDPVKRSDLRYMEDLKRRGKFHSHA